MTKTKNKNKNAQRNRRRVRRNGDNPPPQRCDIMTASCSVPRPSPSYTMRVLHQDTVLGSNVTPNASVYQFQLSFLDDAAAYEAMFDQYRFLAIRQTIRPLQNAIGLTDITANTMVPLYSVIDYDDATALTSAAQARSKENCVILEPGDSLQRTFRPHLAKSVYAAGGFGSYSNESPCWLDTTSPAIQHYAHKIWVPTAHASQVLLQSWNVDTEYFLEFKQHL